ncbi:MAG: hypothetical protein EHM87_00805 [Burkholderiales bacterium]|nr:MAG: hypothetical protein EHM87_00805 [Burkholderiales bacterium]
MTRRAIAAAVWGLSCLAGGLAVCGAGVAAPLEVEVVDASRITRCAEEDNVYVKFVGDSVASFRIVAEHPPYIAAVITDSTAPDFTDCDMSSDPSFAFTPRTVVLHEDATIRLVGHTFATNWRPESVEFRVGDRVETGLHLVQLIRRGTVRDVEMLVVYPADGYWRPKPLPPGSLPDTAYGSSFLVGPVEEDGRPFVAIRSLSFDPATLTFRLVFRDGSRGVLSVAEASSERLALSVTLDPPVAAGRPFAALRSMFVDTAQADVAVARWAGAARGPGQAPILGFGTVTARSARFGRTEPSRHNLSAPDLVFEAFSSARDAGAPR